MNFIHLGWLTTILRDKQIHDNVLRLFYFLLFFFCFLLLAGYKSLR